MTYIDLTINCANIQVNSYRSDLEVQLNNVSVSNLDKDKILNEIGSDYCKDHFNLIDDPEY